MKNFEVEIIFKKEMEVLKAKEISYFERESNIPHVKFEQKDFDGVEYVEAFHTEGLYKVISINDDGMEVHKVNKDGSLSKLYGSTFFFFGYINKIYKEAVVSVEEAKETKEEIELIKEDIICENNELISEKLFNMDYVENFYTPFNTQILIEKLRNLIHLEIHCMSSGFVAKAIVRNYKNGEIREYYHTGQTLQKPLVELTVQLIKQKEVTLT